MFYLPNGPTTTVTSFFIFYFLFSFSNDDIFFFLDSSWRRKEPQWLIRLFIYSTSGGISGTTCWKRRMWKPQNPLKCYIIRSPANSLIAAISRVDITIAQSQSSGTPELPLCCFCIEKRLYLSDRLRQLKIKKKRARCVYFNMQTIDRENFHGNSLWKGPFIFSTACLVLYAFDRNKIITLEATIRS